MLRTKLSAPLFSYPSVSQHKRQKSAQKRGKTLEARRLPRQAPVPRAQDSSALAEASVDEVPRGCSRYSVALSKPLGIVLEENSVTGAITVAELVPEGNADTSGKVRHPRCCECIGQTPHALMMLVLFAYLQIGIGDQLIATSGYTRAGKEVVYGEIVVRGGEKK